MKQTTGAVIETIYPVSLSFLGRRELRRVEETNSIVGNFEYFPELLAHHLEDLSLPDFLPDLARLEWALHAVRSSQTKTFSVVGRLSLNPDLQLLRLSWRNLASLLNPGGDDSGLPPEPGEEYVLVWRHPKTSKITTAPASNEDLLVLKMVAEEVPVPKAAADFQLSLYVLGAAMDHAVEKGLLLAPPSGIRRDSSMFPIDMTTKEDYLSASVFTLQWHITQACDLHCRHCYDRSDRQLLDLAQAIRVLDDLHAFCRDRQVRGQVSFSGGNPLLYLHFRDVYRAASERGYGLAILGNPVSRERIEKLTAIEQPVYYQISLEGLPEHNDFMRGPGHFQRALEFLGVLRDLGVYSVVMLTLTRENIAQVLPLAEMLRDRADLFTFNRLSQVGEGAKLKLPSMDEYVAFLESYVEAARDNPIIGLKDNLINVLHHQRGVPLFGGCTGYGCGAAFNFLCLLSDGNVHACRKFPSPIGNVLESDLGSLYDSEAARAYRRGCRACRSCVIRPVCGGCLAVAHSLGLNIFAAHDPYCFINARPRPGAAVK
jgi:selenobiotic family peptide radical SAM maturase